jgi:hypothetical protein
MKSVIQFAVAAILALTLAGCGGRISISGTCVYADGSPVPEGTISGELEGGGREMIQATVANGSFQFASIPPGKYKIMIQCRSLGDAEMAEGKKPAIDGKFGSYASSGLSLDATSAKTDVKFTVTKPGEKK